MTARFLVQDLFDLFGEYAQIFITGLGLGLNARCPILRGSALYQPRRDDSARLKTAQRRDRFGKGSIRGNHAAHADRSAGVWRDAVVRTFERRVSPGRIRALTLGADRPEGHGFV